MWNTTEELFILFIIDEEENKICEWIKNFKETPVLFKAESF